MGYEELPHTADCMIRVWAPSLTGLLIEAAHGFNAVSGVKVDPRARVRREVSVHAGDAEGLLIAFLSELLFLQEQERLAFDEFDLALARNLATGYALGSPITSLSRPIKAVTFHNLAIRQTSRGLEAEVVFDT